MSVPIRIANCSGFYGDRMTAATEMVEGGAIDVLTGDWLAELTMLILANGMKQRGRDGYARTFVDQMESVMETCLARGIKVVSNAGGLDPAGCAHEIQRLAKSLGINPAIAYVQGDNILPQLDALVSRGQLREFQSETQLSDCNGVLTANVYLGCWGIVDALKRGADIVVTGRTTDAALACGPAAWHHDWRHDDWDALAGAVIAGHAIECGTQVTGGNYSFFQEVAGLTRVGFPWVDIEEDGSATVGKHDGTGGQVSVGTVTSQLLYEIGGPAYLGPDVTARFDTVTLEERGRDRIRITGVKGEPPPETLKVALNKHGGFRNAISVGIVGLNVEEKAAILEEAFWAASRYPREDYSSTTTKLIRSDKPNPATNEEATAVWRIVVKDEDQSKVDRAFSSTSVQLSLATIPGYFSLDGGPKRAQPYGVFIPASISRSLVDEEVTLLGGETNAVDYLLGEITPTHVEPLWVQPAAMPTGPTVRAPFGMVVGARSGDKGANANLGVFARSLPAWAWLDAYLSIERLGELLPETVGLRIERHRLANLRAVNFVIHDLLDGGVAASSRQDPQAKSLAEWLRSRIVNVPKVLLDEQPLLAGD